MCTWHESWRWREGGCGQAGPAAAHQPLGWKPSCSAALQTQHAVERARGRARGRNDPKPAMPGSDAPLGMASRRAEAHLVAVLIDECPGHRGVAEDRVPDTRKARTLRMHACDTGLQAATQGCRLVQRMAHIHTMTTPKSAVMTMDEPLAVTACMTWWRSSDEFTISSSGTQNLV